MSAPPIQFQRNEAENVRLEKLRRLAQMVEDMARRINRVLEETEEPVVPELTMTGPGVLGRLAGTGAPDTLSGLDLNTLMPQFSATIQGVVPSPGTLTGNRFLRDDGAWATVELTGGALADPSALVGLTPVDGTAGTAMRSDAAPALDQGIAPLWTSDHRWGDNVEVQWGDNGEMTAYFDGSDAFVGTTIGDLNLATPGDVTINGEIAAVHSDLKFTRMATFTRAGAAIALPVNDVPIRVDVASTITKVTLLTIGGPGDCVVDIRKDTFANYPPTGADSICAAAKPTIVAGTKYEDATLTGWTTAVSAGDTLIFSLESTSTFTTIVVILEFTR